MKVKVETATGMVLNWMVAKADGLLPLVNKGIVFTGPNVVATYATNWGQSAVILVRENIYPIPNITKDKAFPEWDFLAKVDHYDDMERPVYGPTALVAALRCFVKSKLGDEVEVPDELVKE